LLVVQLCDFLDDGDRYYRYHLPSRQLSQLPGVTVLDCHYLHRHLRAAAEAADVLVVQFIHDWELLALIERRRAAGKVTVFEANDYFFDVQPWNPVSERWRDRAVQEGFRRFLRSADAVQTSSRELARRWREFADTVFVFENHLAAVPPLAEPPARPLTIGWGGSPGHFADWFQVAPLLQRWLDAHPDVHLAVMTNEFARPFLSLPAERYHFTPFGSISDYLRFLGTLDIGLAPLLPSDYNRGRSDVKFLEYAASGVAGIYADLEPYRDSVRHGETGLLYRTGDELIACLDRLASDAALRRRIRTQAHAYVAGQRLAEQHIGERLAAYRGLLRKPAGGGSLPAEVLAAAEREGKYLRLRPQAPEEALAAVAQGPGTAAAVESLARVVERHPGCLAALQQMGTYLNDIRDHPRALAVLEQARRVDQRSARTLCELGRTHFLLDDRGRARTLLDEGLAANPYYLPGWQYLLRLLLLQPSADGPALAARAQELFPACYGLHLAGVALHSPAAAAPLLLQLLNVHAPTFTPEETAEATAAFGDAILRVARAAPQEAGLLPLLQRACQVFPGSPRLADELGRLLHDLAREDESLAEYARARQLRRAASFGQGDAPPDEGTLLLWQLAEHIQRWTARPS
jgi:tetratricopeptide (TPR) repeat protein